MAFKKAVKYEAKGRTALVGPPGSGKSYTALVIARLLAGPDGKIAAVDTEHGSLSKYADLFEFDVCELESFSPDSFMGAMDEAEAAGYAVFMCDSLSHFWMGKDGALEFVDSRAKRNRGDSFAGWKDFRPHEREMIDRIIASPMHVICTMRTKNSYVEEEYVNRNGQKKTKRVKIGLAPVQREGMEYEFDLVATMDDENNFIVDKTRCPAYAGKALEKPKAKDFEPFRDWLRGAPAPLQPKPQTPPLPRAAVAPNFSGVATIPTPPAKEVSVEVQQMWKLMRGSNPQETRTRIREAFAQLQAGIEEVTGSEVEYHHILKNHGLEHGSDGVLILDGGKSWRPIKAASWELWDYLRKCKAEPPPAPDPNAYEATDDDLPENLREIPLMAQGGE